MKDLRLQSKKSGKMENRGRFVRTLVGYSIVWAVKLQQEVRRELEIIAVPALLGEAGGQTKPARQLAMEYGTIERQNNGQGDKQAF